MIRAKYLFAALIAIFIGIFFRLLISRSIGVIIGEIYFIAGIILVKLDDIHKEIINTQDYIFKR